MVRKKPVDLPPDKNKPDSEPVVIMGEAGASLYYPRGTKPNFLLGSLRYALDQPPSYPLKTKLLTFFGFASLDPTLSEVERASRLWQLWILRIGLALPAIAIVEVFVLNAIPSFGLWLGIEPKLITFGEEGPLSIIPTVALFDLITCWPFVALAAAAKRRIKSMWPDVRAARPAIIGALIGLSVIHSYEFFLIGSLMVINDHVVGKMVASVLTLLAMGIGWTLGGLGWLCGSIIGRRMLRRPPATTEPAESD